MEEWNGQHPAFALLLLIGYTQELYYSPW